MFTKKTNQIVLIILFSTILLIVGYSTFKKSQDHSFNQKPFSPSTSSPQPLEFLTASVDSFRRISFSITSDMIIAQVTIISQDLCDGNLSACEFHRSQFSLEDNGVSTLPGGPPLKYIKGFKLRQLTESRTLAKNQSETGQLYFVIPKSQTNGNITYNSQNILQPTFPKSSE